MWNGFLLSKFGMRSSLGESWFHHRTEKSSPSLGSLGSGTIPVSRGVTSLIGFFPLLARGMFAPKATHAQSCHGQNIDTSANWLSTSQPSIVPIRSLPGNCHTLGSPKSWPKIKISVFITQWEQTLPSLPLTVLARSIFGSILLACIHGPLPINHIRYVMY